MAAQVDIILGPSGSGKTGQADRLAVSRRYVHLSSGDLLRAKASPEILSQMEQGELAPSQPTEELIEKAISDIDPNLPILLDGFPRLIEEADWLDQFLAKLDRKLGHVIFLNVPEPELQARLKQRHRDDDVPAAAVKRYREFKKETLAVIKRYSKHHLLVEIDGVGTPDQVAQRILEAL